MNVVIVVPANAGTQNGSSSRRKPVVIPAQAGIQNENEELGPGFRRDDDWVMAGMTREDPR
jgi:hypothetical protein